MADQKSDLNKHTGSAGASSSDAAGAAVDKRPKVGDVGLDPAKEASAADAARATDDGMSGAPSTSAPSSSGDRKASTR